MSKVLHEKITNTNKQAAVKQENNSEQLVTLMQEMKATWQEAASDLLQPRPEAVAIGFYGPDRGGKAFTEDSPPYNDFLGKTCVKWEQAIHEADDILRTVVLRFGIVLGKDGGAYPQLAKPLSFGMMPILGDGKQVVSWIHVHDLARLIHLAIDSNSMTGTYNAVSPNPVAHKELMQTIARQKGGLKVPAPVPAFMLKVLLGEMSIEVLKSCTVSGAKLQDTGFSLMYPDIDKAVEAIIAGKHSH